MVGEVAAREVRLGDGAVCEQPVRRTPIRANDAGEPLLAHDARAVDPARDRHGRAGRRQEPAAERVQRLRRRAGGDRAVAPRPVPAVRRRHHVLGPRRAGESAGGDPRDRHARASGRHAGHGARASDPGRDRARLGARAPRPAGRRRDRAGFDRRADRGVHRMAPLSRSARHAPNNDPRLRRPALGRRRDARFHRAPCGMGLGRPAPCGLHRAARAVRRAPGVGWRQAELDDVGALTADGGGDLRADRRAAPRNGIAEEAAVDGRRAVGRQSAVRGRVRAHAVRPRRHLSRGRETPGHCRPRGQRAGHGPRTDRRASGHGSGRAQGAAAGRRCRRQGVLVRRRRHDGRPGGGGRKSRAARAGPARDRPSRSELVGERPSRVRVLARPRPRCRLRTDPPRVARAEAPRRGRMDRADGG